jgi:hypothetical protein
VTEVDRSAVSASARAIGHDGAGSHGADFWLARASIVLVASLQYLLINNIYAGPRWLAPSIELALLAPLSAASAWTHAMSRTATEPQHRQRIQDYRFWIRLSAVLLIAFVTVMNFIALGGLVQDLLSGAAMTGGTTLLVDALNIWVTNMIVFTLWFWNLDRGGLATRGIAADATCDFLFPQAILGDRLGQSGWEPGFVDYLYLSFTNSTAFSPTDTSPLTARAKLLMMAEAIVSLLTIALVAARAVNILA